MIWVGAIIGAIVVIALGWFLGVRWYVRQWGSDR